jgi:DNA polymerase-3 subunit chi
MTQVDFYVLEPTGGGSRQTLACRIAEKAWSQGHRVLVHCASAEEARQVDRLLWTFRDQSFVPHGLLGEADVALNPVLVTHGGEAGEEHDVLVNLAPATPVCFSRFARVAEPVDNDPEARAASRERFKFYRDRGYQPTTHNVG